MTNIFIGQWETEQRLREEARKAEALCLENSQKAKCMVLVYVWLEDNGDPSIVELQEGFMWPHLVLNKFILTRTGIMTSSSSAPPSINIYHPLISFWTITPLNFVVDLNRDSPCVFLKPLHVHCNNIASYLSFAGSSQGWLDVY
ncbi:hypothetical protein NLJ89_g12217 [Agrocybe chaxingu]|uniref:Uncharacterized protein n=1 Tax=Agrocybe chaxingu TaxID=84603 RepID=A0A9W8JKE6_9AGAR|nr:hypothetical protein NLJ89_g12217 [Agrocybe chaxingu]